jgi:hypothetical protein
LLNDGVLAPLRKLESDNAGLATAIAIQQ